MTDQGYAGIVLFRFWTGVDWGSDLRFSLAFAFLLFQFVCFDQWSFVVVVGFLPFLLSLWCCSSLLVRVLWRFHRDDAVFVDVFYPGCIFYLFHRLLPPLCFCLRGKTVWLLGLCSSGSVPAPVWSIILSGFHAGLFGFDSELFRRSASTHLCYFGYVFWSCSASLMITRSCLCVRYSSP